MYTHSWQIIRDDNRKTFEVQGQEENTDPFTNLVHGMQKLGMTVTAMVLPITNKHANPENISFAGYTREPGLYLRLMKEYRLKMTEDLGQWEE